MDDYSQSQKYLESGEGEKALPILRRLADGGMLAAMHSLGHTYLYGVGGVQQDYDTAFQWFSRAAANGCPQGMYHCGVCNAEGFGTPCNPEQALEWFKKSAARGDEDAMYRAGDCYEKGFGTAADRDEAVKWYEKAAAYGQDEAEERLKALEE